MRVALISMPLQENTGIGRYTAQLHSALLALGHEVLLVNPTVPIPKLITDFVMKVFGWDLVTFFNTYPLWAHYPPADIYHLTSQNLATLLVWRRPPGKTVITVHDIIPWLLKDDPVMRIYDSRLEEWFDWLALKGLRRANGWISDSLYSKESIQPLDLLGDVLAPAKVSANQNMNHTAQDSQDERNL